MKLAALKQVLQTMESISFVLPNGKPVQPHFHITEVGRRTKDFIDCGGTVQQESVVNLQLWLADDIDYRLTPEKLLSIIELSEEKLNLENLEVEVEYQTETVGHYQLQLKDSQLLLIPTKTDCLAPDKCLVPAEKNTTSCCSSGCC
jgi:hypothetical protein